MDRIIRKAVSEFISSSMELGFGFCSDRLLPLKSGKGSAYFFLRYSTDINEVFEGKEKIFKHLIIYSEETGKSDYLRHDINRVKIEYLFYDRNLNH